MLARVIAADNGDNLVVETPRAGCILAQSKSGKLEVNDYIGGPFDRLPGSEIEVQPLPSDARCRSFKLSILSWFPSAEEALNDSRSNSSATGLRLRVPPYRNPKSVARD